MLPHSLLSLEPAGLAPSDGDQGEGATGGRCAPRYLRTRDEVWIARAIQETLDLAGSREADIEEAWVSRILPSLRAMGARKVAALGIKLVLERLTTREVSAPADPRRIREIVFRYAAQRPARPREQNIVSAANALLLTPEEVERGLFADRAGERIRKPLPPDVTPASLIEKYNLALVQGVLLRAEWVSVELKESVRAVVRYAKLQGLLADFAPTRSHGLRMDVSGPLALFRNTLKYGRALANFFPTLTAAPSFALAARCRVANAPGAEVHVIVAVDHHAPLARGHALPRDADSSVERALVRDVRKSKSGYTIHRETVALRAGPHLVFPDFALRRGNEEVLVEVVGYYTEEYLRRKTVALREANVRNLIVCVDTSLDCGEAAFGDHAVVPFRKRIDVAALLSAADKVLERRA